MTNGQLCSNHQFLKIWGWNQQNSPKCAVHVTCTHSSYRTKAVWTEGRPTLFQYCVFSQQHHYNTLHSFTPYQLLLLSPVHHQSQVSPSRPTAGGSEYSLGQTDAVGRRSPLSPHTPSPVEMILVPFQQLKQKLKQLYTVTCTVHCNMYCKL